MVYYLLETVGWTREGEQSVCSPLSQIVDGALVPVTSESDTLSWNVTVGADRYPQFDCESHAESYSRLRNAQLIHQGSDSFSISSTKYRNDKFVGAMNLEKCPGASSHTGINTRSGSQLSLNFKNLGAATQLHVVLHFECVVTCSAASVEVLD